MEILPLILRLFHVAFGLLWVGMAIVMTLAIGPTMMGLGLPERKAFQLQFLPRQGAFGAIGAFGTLLTGLGLLYAVYAGETGRGWANDAGYWIMLGSTLGIGAFSIGMAVIVPGAKRMEKLLKGEGDPAQIGPLAAKMAKTAPVVLFHMLTATVAMLAAAHGAVFSALNVVLVLGSALVFGLALITISRRIKA